MAIDVCDRKRALGVLCVLVLFPGRAAADLPQWTDDEWQVDLNESVLDRADEDLDPEGDVRATTNPREDIVAGEFDEEPLALPTGEDKSGVTPQTLSLPSDGGSIEGLGESFSPLLSSGTATMSVPVALPAGRRELQPSLAFSYSSSAGNGPLGIGWSIQVPFIARQTDKGLPRYDGTDRFLYNGGQELVEVAPAADEDGDASNGNQAETIPSFLEDFRYFRARVDNLFMRLFLAPNESYWVVEDKRGTFFYLGETPDSRVEHPNWGVYSWSLTRMIDVRGNEVRYVYRAKDETRQVYLDQVVWNTPVTGVGAAVAPVLLAPTDEFQHTVVFAYEAREDDVESYVSRFAVRTGERLVQLEVQSFLDSEDAVRTLDRRYLLEYDDDTFLSLLSSLTVVGRDGTALPPMAFGYSTIDPHAGEGGDLDSGLPGWGGFDGRTFELANSPAHSIDEARTDLFDIDADAFPDLLVTDPARFDDGHGVFFLDIVEGIGTYTDSDVIVVPDPIGHDLSLSNSNVNPMDLDGDGHVEMLHMPHIRDWSAFSAQGTRDDGFAWVEKGPFEPVDGDIDFTRNAAEIRLVDLDNDHRVDVLRTSGSRYEFFRNVGDGVFEPPVVSCVMHRGMPLRFSNGDLQLADMNGDGLQDLVHLRRGNLAYWPGRGYGLWGGDGDLPEDCPEREFGNDREVVVSNTPRWSDLEDDRIRLSDVNGDGLTDLVQTRFAGVDVWINEAGRRFAERYVIERSPFDPSFTQRVRLTDVNASGSRDILWGDGGRYRYMDLAGAIRPRLLTQVDNGLGKTTRLEYEAHTAQQSRAADAGDPWDDFSPTPVQVVRRMTVEDGLGGSNVTEYEYRDALYDGIEAEFRGFRQAIVRALGDANHPTSEERTVFWRGERPIVSDQDDNPYEAMKGLVRLTEKCDQTGVCMETTHTTWTVRRRYDGIADDPRSVWQAFTSQTDTFRYDTAPFDPDDDTLNLAAVTGDAPAVTDVLHLVGGVREHLRSEAAVDAVGNERLKSALGVVGISTDDVETATEYDNLGSWLWQPVTSRVLAEPTDLKETTKTYSAFGEIEEERVYLEEETRDVLAVVNAYNATGQVRQVEEGGTGGGALRKRTTVYDADFAAYVVSETTWTDVAASVTTTAVWDAGFGVVLVITDYAGEDTVVEYDGLARISSITRPGCVEAAVRYEYVLAGDTGEPWNDVVTRSNEHCGDGEATSLETSLESHAYVDGLSRARMTVSEADVARGDGDNWVRSGFVTFDAKGQPARAYRPDFRATPDFSLALPGTGYTSTRYDAFGRETRVVAEDRVSATETRYHALSRDVWDANDLDPASGHYGTPTTHEEDGQGRRLKVIERNLVDGDLEEYEIGYTYDPLGNVTEMERAFGATTVQKTLIYDSLGRRISSDDPNCGVWEYEYSDVGEIIATEDARDVRVAYVYDLAGRLLEEDYEDDATVDVAYTYDEARSFGTGRLTTVVDPSGTTELFYDARGREVRMRRTLDFDSVAREEERAYDERDQETALEYPDGSVATKTYSDRGLFYAVELLHDADGDSSVDDTQSVVARTEYDANGKKVLEELGDEGGTRNEYTYDRRQRLVRLSSVLDDPPGSYSLAGPLYLQDLQYEYDRVSNIVALRDLRTEVEAGTWSPKPADQEYVYDALYRLVKNESTYLAVEPTRPVLQTWRYDYLGNMVEWTDDDDRFFERSLGTVTNGVDDDPTGETVPNALVSATLDVNNHLEATYNPSGDMETLSVTKASVTTVHDYEWDAAHRMASATVGSDTTTFAYDYGDHRRVKDSASATVLYVTDRFELRDGIKTKWVQADHGRTLRVDTVSGVAETSFYLTNHLGTTSFVLADDSDARSAATYLPYGAEEKEIVSDPGFDSAYRFTGKERDVETDLDYFGARYYAAALGRWLSPDPLQVHDFESTKASADESAPGEDHPIHELAALNPFAYVSDNPIKLVDPLGLEATPAAQGSISVAGAFPEPTTATDPGPSPTGADAVTAFKLSPSDWRETARHVGPNRESGVHMVVRPEKIETTYYGEATANSPHDADGTLGRHEARHQQDYKTFFTRANLRERVEREGFKLQYTFSRDDPDQQIRAVITQQVQDIESYLIDAAEYESTYSRDPERRDSLLIPVFFGDYR